MHLKRRLWDATERSVLLQILKEVEKDPKNYGNIVDALCDSQSLALFGKFLTVKEYTTRLEPILLAQDPLTSIIIFAKCVTSIKNENFREVMIVLGWLKAFVEEHLEKSIIQSLKVGNGDAETLQKYREFAVGCVNLPEKISNCRLSARNEEHVKYVNTVSFNFKHHLLSGIQKALESAHSDGKENNLRTLSELTSAGRNMQMDDNFALLYKLLEWISKIPKFDEKWSKMIGELFVSPTFQGFQVHEALLTSLFLCVDKEEQLKRCLPVTEISGTLKRVVLVKLPFQRVLEPWTIKLLVDFVIRTKESMAHGMLETAIKIWSDINFAKTTPDDREKHIVRVIAYLVHRLRKSSEIPWDQLFLHASNGVHTRLELLPTFMRSAIFINSTLAMLASENAPEAPKLEDVTVEDDSGWAEEMKNILENGIQKPKKQKIPVIVEEIPKKKEIIQEIPQKTLDSDDEEEDFPTYNVADSERNFQKLKIGEDPKHVVPPPKYIADAFEQLLEREKYEIFEAAFYEMPRLIRRRAIGFAELAEPIVLRVVTLQNTFGSQKFEETVEEIATCAIAHRPEIVPNLIRLVIYPGQAVQTQQKLLHFIHKAADEMGVLDSERAEFVEDQHHKLEIVHRGVMEIRPSQKVPAEPEEVQDSDDDEEEAPTVPSAHPQPLPIDLERLQRDIHPLVNHQVEHRYMGSPASIVFEEEDEQEIIVTDEQEGEIYVNYDAETEEVLNPGARVASPVNSVASEAPEDVINPGVHRVDSPAESVDSDDVQDEAYFVEMREGSPDLLDRRDIQEHIGGDGIYVVEEEYTEDHHDYEMPPHLLQPRSRPPANFRRHQPNGGGPGWREFVDARIRSNTRIISKGRQVKKGVVNRLGQNVQYMFYPLLVLPRGEMTRLLNRDSDLLALIIMVASMVYVRSGVNPSVARMSTELISYVRPHRFSENSKVRTACLSAYLNVMALLPQELLTTIFTTEERQTWQEWAGGVTMNHNTGEIERVMAQQLSGALYQHFTNISMQNY